MTAKKFRNYFANKKKLICDLLLVIISLVLTILFSNKMDDVVLIDNTIYFNKLRIHSGYDLYIDKSIADEFINNNYFINGYSDVYKEKDGFELFTDVNGALIFEGRNEGGDIAFTLSPGNIQLPNGKYILSDGGISTENCYIYLEGWKENGGTDVLAKLPEKKVFYADDNTYCCYWYGINIKSGYENSKVTFLPYIGTNTDSDTSFIGAPTSMNVGEDNSYHYALFFLNKDTLSVISERDWRRFLNSLEYYFKNEYDWVSIMIGNDIAIEFRNNMDWYIGRCDRYGRVEKKRVSYHID